MNIEQALQDAFAATLYAGTGCALSHRTAAWLFKLEGLGREAPRPIDLSVSRNHSRLISPAISMHYRKDFEVLRQKDGALPRTTLAQTIIDLATELEPQEYEFALDSAQRRYAWLPRELQRRLKNLPKRGTALLRELLAVRTEPTDSPLEVKVLRALRASGLPQPTLRHCVYDGEGYVARLDFAWLLHRVALHVDSYSWHLQRQRFELDAKQRSRLAALDWVSLVVTSSALDANEWIDTVKRTLDARSPQFKLFEDRVTCATRGAKSRG